MKAVVLDIKKDKAVALSDDGMVKEVTNKNFRIGQTIEMERKSMKKMSKKYRNIAAGIAASLVILLGGGTAYAYNTPVAHVSLDVNPSITYSVNVFNKVIAEESNLDAVDILQTIDWDGKNINKVVEDTILALKEKNYLENDTWYEDSIIIGVNATSTDKENKLILAIKNELAKIVAEETDKKIDTADLEEVVIGIGAQRVADAAKLSEDLGFAVTPGKLNLVQKLNASYTELGNEDLTSSEAAVWLKGSVKDIMAQVKANRIANRSTTTEALDADLTDNALDNNGNGNNNSNNDNGNINNNGNDKGNVNTNDNANVKENATEMEKERNGNANENSISHGTIETENN
ncbi:MAG TPA: hypothetical protein VFC41_03405 [Anaerovoracaceae bacterium]|nr:hypothetical protein [Anaerovoracaceae bacterium]